MSASEVVLSDQMLNCILIQTKPGKELSVKKELEANLNGVLVLVGLGRYDLVVLSEQLDFSVFEQFRKQRFRDIIDWSNVCGGKWVKKERRTKPFFNNDVKEIGICLIKLLKSHDSLRQADLEESIVSQLLQNDKFHVYSNLSNYELVCLFSAENLQELDDAVKILKNAMILNENLIILDMMTIPAINLNRVSELSESTRILIFGSLRMGISGEFKKAVEDLFRNQVCKLVQLMPAYGFHDVIIHVEGNLSAIVQSILTLRTQGEKYGLFSTFTLVEQKGHIFDYRVPTQAKMNQTQSVDAKEYRETRDTEAEDELVSYFANLLIASREDDLTRDLFRNHGLLIDKMNEIASLARKFRKTGDKDTYQTLELKYDNLADCIRTALSQRYCSIIPGNLLGTKSLGLEPHGGIQRAILAAESLPFFIFRKLGITWSGFCVFGYYHNFFRQEGGVFNIPTVYRVRPANWGGGFFHEIGHEVFLSLPSTILAEVEDFIVQLTTDLARSYRENDRFVDEERLIQEITSIAVELFADLFSLATGYQCNWEKYVNDLWSDLAREFPINFERFTRSIMVYLTLGPGRSLTRTAQLDSQSIRGWIDKLDTIVKNTLGYGVPDEEKTRAEDLIPLLAELGRLLLPFFESNQFWKTNLSENEASLILKRFSDGMVYKTENPLEIINALITSSSPLTLKENLVALLSLYNAYWNLDA